MSEQRTIDTSRPPRRKNQHKHAVKRAMERHGAGEALVVEAARLIRKARKHLHREGIKRGGQFVAQGERVRDDAMLLKVLDGSKELWKVTICGKAYVVGYNAATRRLQTVLPEDNTNYVAKIRNERRSSQP